MNTEQAVVTNGSGKLHAPAAKKPRRKWSAAQLAKYRATCLRKRKERAKAARSAPKGGNGRRSKEGRREDAVDRAIARHSDRGISQAAAQRADAIVYLEHAVGHYEIPDEILLALLALRRLQGRIK